MKVRIRCSRPGCKDIKWVYRSLLDSPSQQKVKQRFCSRSCQAIYYNPILPGLKASRKRHTAPWLRKQNLAVNSILGKQQPNVEQPRLRGRRKSRVVMERSLGRKLRPEELVHHKNENRLDNRRRNLKLMSRSGHISFHQKKRFDAWKASQ